MNNSILLADDDAAVRRFVGGALMTEGYDVVTARTARQACHAFQHQSPDLVLLDVNLPDTDMNLPVKDGWDAFQVMNQMRRWVPIIIITGMPSQFVHASRLGAAGLMEKPLDLLLLFQTVKRMLDKSKLEMAELQMEKFYDEVPHSSAPCILLEPESNR